MSNTAGSVTGVPWPHRKKGLMPRPGLERASCNRKSVSYVLLSVSCSSVVCQPVKIDFTIVSPACSCYPLTNWPIRLSTASHLMLHFSWLSKLLHLELRARVMERFNRPQHIV